MTNNDMLRQLRYALEITDPEMVAIFALVGHSIDESTARGLTQRDSHPEFIALTDEHLAFFLDGLVIDRRGPRPDGLPPVPPQGKLTNNQIFKKLRIALELQEAQVLAVLANGGHVLSKHELTALFRKPTHKHYRACGDQILRNFIRGLTLGRPEE